MIRIGLVVVVLVSVLGLGADQNSVTLNGMQMGANGLPRDAAISSSPDAMAWICGVEPWKRIGSAT